MPDTQIPTYGDLMYPTLVALKKLGGSASNSELEEAVVETANVSDAQLAVEYPEGSRQPGFSKVLHRIHWARTYLKIIGAVENSARGVWSLAPGAAKYLEMDPKAADKALKAADKKARSDRRKAKAKVKIEGDGDGDLDDDTAPTWSDQLLDILKKMDPAAFERLAMRLLREAGFRNVEVLGKSGDGGIDGVGVYRVSLVSFPTYFQCKRYQGSVPPSAVRDFRGAMTGRGEKGLLISTGTYSPAAKAEANRDGAPPVDLIDGNDLCALLKDYNLGVEVEKRVIEDVRVDVGFFSSV